MRLRIRTTVPIILLCALILLIYSLVKLKVGVQRRYAQDSHFQSLAEGTYVTPPYTLSVLLYSTSLNGKSPQLRDAYLDFKRGAEAILRGTGAYFLELTALTIPLASIFPLHVYANVPLSVKKKYGSMWSSALKQCALPSKLKLQIHSPILTDAGEAYFPVSDTDGASEPVRDCLLEAAARLPRSSDFFLLPSSLRLTFMKFALPKELDVGEKDIVERWGRVISLWPNHTTMILHSDSVYLVEGDCAVVLSSRDPRASVLVELNPIPNPKQNTEK